MRGPDHGIHQGAGDSLVPYLLIHSPRYQVRILSAGYPLL
jgi:hypothetical protein